MQLRTADFGRFANVRHGNVYLNRTTGRLNVRGGNFLSRIVTWIKQRHNPNRVNQEYKVATAAFIDVVKRQHNEICRRYDPDYSISETNFEALYRLNGDNRPLKVYEVNETFNRLNGMPTVVELADQYSNLEYCRRHLIDAMKNTDIPDTHTFGAATLEKLSSQIKKKVMEESCRGGGWLTGNKIESVAQSVIKEYAESVFLKSVIKYANPRYCAEQTASELKAIDMEYYKNYEPSLAELDKLAAQIEAEIIKEDERSGNGITEDAAFAITQTNIRDHVHGFKDSLHEKQAFNEMIAKIQAKVDAADFRSRQAADKEIAEAYAEAEISRACQEALDRFDKKIAQLEKEIKADLTMEEPIEGQNQEIEKGNAAEADEAHQIIEEIKSRGIKLPMFIDQQYRRGKINSRLDLKRANNWYSANEVLNPSVYNWYIFCYRRAIGKIPTDVPKELFTDIVKDIQSSDDLILREEAETYAKYKITEYVNSLTASS